MKPLKPIEIISVDPETMGGTPVFKNTRVPVQALFDYLESGDRIDDFLDDFPSVQHEQVLGLLKVISSLLLKVENKTEDNENTPRREHPEKIQAIAI